MLLRSWRLARGRTPFRDVPTPVDHVERCTASSTRAAGRAMRDWPCARGSRDRRPWGLPERRLPCPSVPTIASFRVAPPDAAIHRLGDLSSAIATARDGIIHTIDAGGPELGQQPRLRGLRSRSRSPSPCRPGVDRSETGQRGWRASSWGTALQNRRAQWKCWNEHGRCLRSYRRRSPGRPPCGARVHSNARIPLAMRCSRRGPGRC
ncbi:MAG: hypothetical protein JWO62_127 [Acidimicrobiaceae bacterium]|nr:hypothetical protein [Acidimicrobiaceae bacterium]